MKTIFKSPNITSCMQEQRSYLERLEKIGNELFDLSMKIHLDDREQIEIEASLKRTEKLYDSQYLFVKQIEKEVLKRHFIKQNNKPYTDRDDIIKFR